jgi:alpha-ketoglutarate-dependent taurine dioxygenase
MLEFVPLGPGLSFGAEVRGVDLRAGRHGEAELAQIEAAWLTHHLLLFRGQRLAPPDEVWCPSSSSPAAWRLRGACVGGQP